MRGSNTHFAESLSAICLKAIGKTHQKSIPCGPQLLRFCPCRVALAGQHRRGASDRKALQPARYARAEATEFEVQAQPIGRRIARRRQSRSPERRGKSV